ncbi:MAG: iron ABC transporter permease [Sphaerochaetaceae bacterium]|nr:iron ABC transporter permease [Sphaerochaetaceae bacterium]
MNKSRLLTRSSLSLLFLVIGWFIVAFILLPVVGVLREVFFAGGRFSFESFRKLFSSSRVVKSLTNTYLMTLCTIVTVNIVGIFQILVTEYFDVKGSKLLNIGFMTTLVYGGISLVSGYSFCYSPNGVITKLLASVIPGINMDWFKGFAGVLFVHSFSLTSSHLLFVKTAFKKVDYSTIEAAKSLGGSNLNAFVNVALPIVKPSLFTATILVALASMNSFAAPSMIGGKNFYMINSMIQNLNSINRRDLAALLSLILAVTCIVLLTVFRSIEQKGSYISVSKVPTKLKKIKIKNPIVNIIIHALAYVIFLIYVMPIIMIFLFSFNNIANITQGELSFRLTLENYARVFSRSVVIKPFINSMRLSIIAVGIQLMICVSSSLAIHKFKNKATTILEYALLIPWILPATLLIVGLISLYSLPSPLVFGQTLLGGFWLLPIAYAVGKIPSGMRLTRASLYQINHSQEEASRSLGASSFYTFRKILIPVITPTIISIGAISFNGLLSEYTISALLYNVNNVPLGIVLRTPEMVPDPYAEASHLVFLVMLISISTITLFATKKARNKM